MRRGEVLGVRWKDIDLDSGELAIIQTITNVNGKLTVGSPKTTKSRRVIYLDETTVTMLRQHRGRQREDQIAMGRTGPTTAAWPSPTRPVSRFGRSGSRRSSVGWSQRQAYHVSACMMFAIPTRRWR